MSDASGVGESHLSSNNWFVALNGRINRVETADEALARMLATQSEDWCLKYRDKIDARHLEMQQRFPKRWQAASAHVPKIIGHGDTPEEAIRDFEERMRLP